MPSQFLSVALEAAKNAEEIITAYYNRRYHEGSK